MKVSILVPIYNVEKYVRVCLDSLLAQTYPNIQIYAINDGSPANEQVIIEEYAKQYPDKVKAIQKENGGYGSVLQWGIENCDSEYFLVCDPDDYLRNDAVETLVNLAKKHSADVVIGGKYFIYSDGSEQDYDAAYNTNFVKIVPDQAIQMGTKEYEDLFFVDPSPHAKLYRRELAKRIQFPTKVGYTDNLLFYSCILQSKVSVYTDQALAYYLIDRAGNTMTDVKPQVIDAHTRVFTEILAQTKGLPGVCGMYYYRMFEAFKFTFYQLRRISGTKEEKLEKAQNLYQFLEDLQPYYELMQPAYRHYTASKWLERRKEKSILVGNKTMQAYMAWATKLISETE